MCLQRAWMNKYEKVAHWNVMCAWQGLSTITSYQMKPSSSSSENKTSLLCELNIFYARFVVCAPVALNGVISITKTNIRKSFMRINPQKLSGPDGRPSRILKTCAGQLAGVFADIINLSLLRSEVPTGFKRASITLQHKKRKAMCLNDYQPVVPNIRGDEVLWKVCYAAYQLLP